MIFCNVLANGADLRYHLGVVLNWIGLSHNNNEGLRCLDGY